MAKEKKLVQSITSRDEDFAQWFFGIFISFYYDDVFAASSGICDGEICSCFIYNEPYDVSA